MSVPVTITEAAALHIKDMMKEHEEENAFLRVGVKGGGLQRPVLRNGI